MTGKKLAPREVPEFPKTSVPAFAESDLVGAVAEAANEEYSLQSQTFADRPAITSRAWWRHSVAERPPLRVGLLLNGPEMSSLSAAVIEDIQASNFAKIELAVYHKSPPTPRPPRGMFRPVIRTLTEANLRSHALYNLYQRFERRQKPKNHPLDPVDCSNLLSSIESFEVEPIRTKFVHRFPSEAIDRIRAKELDVLVRFGFNILKGDILTSARYGVWSYHHGDNTFYRGGPPHFWELWEGAELSGVILQVLTEQLDAGLVLCKSLFPTQTTLSVSVNRFVPYWGASDLVIRKLNELHRFGWEHVRQNAVPPEPYRGKRKIYRTPTNAEMARWLGPALLKKALQRPFRRDTIRHWKIGVRRSGKPLFEELNSNLEGVRWIESTKGHFWADPFVVEHDGKMWAFFEDHCYKTSQGLIACAELSEDGTLLSPTPCLQTPGCHYSYPYVFRDGGELLMIPEGRDSRAVELYRCADFPHKWERCAVLLRGKYVDTSVWKDGGLWWMLTTSADPDSRAAMLFLFFAEQLTGPWRFHPANPISSDIRNSRGAGRVFFDGKRWIRPSQSCSPVYGYSFTLNEICTVSTAGYAEQALREFHPEVLGRVTATHTYNWLPGVELIDGRVTTPADEI